MKFLIVTLGSIGDLLPFLAVAEKLRARGHTVAIASNAGYAQLVRMAGFGFTAIWDRPLQALDDDLAHDPAKAWRSVHEQMFVPATQPAYDFIAASAGREKTVILASWSAFGARLAHEKLDIPLCTVWLSPHAMREQGAPPATGRAAARSVGFFPDWFGPADWPDGTRLTGFPLFDDALVPGLPAELEIFLANGPAPVIFTPGSFMRQSARFFREALAVCEALGLRAVFLTPHRDQIPANLPSRVLHFTYVGLQKLAPRGTALVHHGGIGTTAQAMRAGIPQLVTPVFFDQFDNGARIEALGIGRVMGPAKTLEEALAGLLGSAAVRRDCAHVRGLFGARDAAADICSIAETLC